MTEQVHTSTSRSWSVLIGSAVFESVWATELAESDGFTRFWPVVIFLVASVISMAGLGYAMKQLPVSVSYAVWTGVGAALTVIIAVAMGNETMSVWKAVFLSGIVGAVIGLRMVDSREQTRLKG